MTTDPEGAGSSSAGARVSAPLAQDPRPHGGVGESESVVTTLRKCLQGAAGAFWRVLVWPPDGQKMSTCTWIS